MQAEYNNRAALQDIFDRTQFPFMGVDWQTHTNNIGHKDFPGCFRCHDGKHLSPDNQAIRLECNICHSIPQVALPGQPAPPDHAGRTEDTCQMCHKPAASGTGGELQPTVTAEPGEPGTGGSEKPPSIPHELAGREDCLLCHNPAGGIKPAPPDHAGRANESCQMCHKPED